MHHSKWPQVADQIPIGIMVLSLQGDVIFSNQASDNFWLNCIDCTSKEHFLTLLKTDLNDLLQMFSNSNQQSLNKKLHLKPDAGGPYQFPYEVWLNVQVSAIRDEAGQLSEILLTHQDISSEEYNRQAIENIALGVSSLSGQDFYNSLVLHLARIFDAKYAFIGLLNQQPGAAREITTTALCANGEIAENFSYHLDDTPCSNVFGKQTCAIRHGVQALYPDDLLLQEMQIEGYIGAPIFDPQGKPLGIMVVLDTKPLDRVDQVRNILEIFAARAGAEIQRQNAERQVHRMAYEDYLTRLPNRSRLYEHLQALLKRQSCGTKQTQAALFMIDLDHFKTLNDALGHDIGDEIIRKAGERLRARLDSKHFIARIGGDEFVVLAEDDKNGISTPEVQLLAQKLNYLLSQPFQIGDRIINVGASVGAVLFPQPQLPEQHSELDLMRFADIALYQAKSAGRGQCVIYSPEHQLAVNDRLDIERGLREALDEHQLQLFMQPQVNLNGQILGAEVLLRWQHPVQGMIPPMRFIPIAEETGLILRLGNWVLDNTLAQIAHWQAENQPMPEQVSINVSAWQFSQTDFVDQLKTLLHKWQIAPGLLVLELTETALLRDIDEARSKLETLRQLGFRISLDDFGTGYSSLAYLRDLPLDELKIDKSFIDEVKAGQRQPLVESMIAIGQHMALDVIAEGVETREQAEQLHAMGCLRYQGYHYARPMPAENLSRWIAAQQLPTQQHHSQQPVTSES